MSHLWGPPGHRCVEDLARVTALLHARHRLAHFGASAALQKHVFTDPQWLADVLAALGAYAQWKQGTGAPPPAALCSDVWWIPWRGMRWLLPPTSKEVVA